MIDLPICVGSDSVCALTWKEHVHELTIGAACAQLLDFGKIGSERVIDPI